MSLSIATGYAQVGKDAVNAAELPAIKTSSPTKSSRVIRYLRREILRFHRQENISKVIEYCGYLSQKEGFTPEFYYYLGDSYLQAREFVLAERELKKVPKTDPNYNQALFRLADIEKTFGHFSESKKYLELIGKSGSDTALSKLIPLRDRALDGLPYSQQLTKEPPIAVLYKITQINHPYSDISPTLLDSSHLIYTHVVDDSAVSEEQGKRIFSNTRLSEAIVVNGEWADSKDLSGFEGDFNRFVNGSFDYETSTLYLTRVEEGVKRKYNSLYYSKLEGSKFRTPKKMGKFFNPNGSQNQHPFVSELTLRGVKTKVMFFTSNRPGGYGGKDIWYSLFDSKAKKWLKPVNAGNYINTIGNEITPSFDSTLQVLYFSSDYQIGLGGYDVFQVKWDVSGFYPAKNMGRPINSGYDDHYFYRIPGTREGLISSNRPDEGSNNTCCHDLFQVSIVNLKGEIIMPTKRTEERGYKPVLTLYFPTNTNELTKAQIRQLDSLSFDILVNSHKTVLLKGHTDDVGSKSYNLTLSEKRAQVVFDYLSKKKVEGHRMLKAAVEMREPAIPYEQLSGDALENARNYNRRVEIFMISQ